MWNRHGGFELDLADNWLRQVFQDPGYLAKVVPDEEKFLKRHEATMMVGWDEELWTGDEDAAKQ